MTLPSAYGDGFVGFSNSERVMYLKGDEYTDGSLRMIVDPTGELFEFQFRAGGNWNDTGIQVAAATVHIGRDLSISGAGEWIQSESVNTGDKALIPHVNFTTNGTEQSHSPVLGVKRIRQIVQSDFSTEFTGTILQSVNIGPSLLLATKVYFKTGSIGATEDMTIIFRRGNTPTSPIIWRWNFPASLMGTPNAEFEVDLLGEIGGEPGEAIFTQIISTAPLSLLGNPAGNFWVAIDFFPQDTEDIVLDNLLLGQDAGIVFANDGSFVINDRFRRPAIE